MATKPSLALLLILSCRISAVLSLQTDQQFSYFWQICAGREQTLAFEDYGILGFDYSHSPDCYGPPGAVEQECNKQHATGWWKQGLWPTVAGNGTKVNGGIPQAGNLTLHLETITNTIGTWLPNVSWDGFALLDFEDWKPVWDIETWKGKTTVYSNLSIARVRDMHPDWSPGDPRVADTAKEEFEAAATRFFVATIEHCKQLRPRARWGYYGFPFHFYQPQDCTLSSDGQWQCGYEGLSGEYLRSLGDGYLPVIKASTALLPSIYLEPHDLTCSTSCPCPCPETTSHAQNAAYIASVLRESVALAEKAAPRGEPRIPIVAYYTPVYMGPYPRWILDPVDTHASLVGSYNTGIDGLIIWGNSADGGFESPGWMPNMTQLIGPMIKQFQASINQCAESHCTNHGRCQQLDYNVTPADPVCNCNHGWTGAHCEEKV